LSTGSPEQFALRLGGADDRARRFDLRLIDP
jgi:hypothetical protein